MPKSRMSPEERRAQIRDCAVHCFAEQGYHATSVADIVQAAGVAQGTFYNYFESKRAIFDDVLDGLLVELQAAARPVALDEGSAEPMAQLRANVERVLAILLGQADVTKLLLSEAVGLDAEADAKLRAFYRRLLDLLGSALQWGQQLGLTRGGDPQLQARMVLGCCKEVVVHLLELGVRRPAPDLVEQVLKYNLKGLLA
ncbi:MAG: TetR/AcrR family transcriptional regulator [Planctomycetota bacterium]